MGFQRVLGVLEGVSGVVLEISGSHRRSLVVLGCIRGFPVDLRGFRGFSGGLLRDLRNVQGVTMSLMGFQGVLGAF